MHRGDCLWSLYWIQYSRKPIVGDSLGTGCQWDLSADIVVDMFKKTDSSGGGKENL